jgi:hypothetical protein
MAVPASAFMDTRSLRRTLRTTTPLNSAARHPGKPSFVAGLGTGHLPAREPGAVALEAAALQRPDQGVDGINEVIE